MMAEVPAKRRVNRAVAAVSEATSGQVSHSPLIAAAQRPCRADAVFSRRVNRYPHFNALVKARLVQDPHAALRTEWEGLQRPPPPRDEFSVLSDETIVNIFEWSGPFTKDCVQLAASCRRLRHLFLARCPPVTVGIVPDMMQLAHLGSATILSSLAVYLSRQTRGQRVRQLALVEAKHSQTLPLVEKYPAVDLPRTLRVVAEMPYLQLLDIRCANWSGAANEASVNGFLNDLHLVAPQLRSLKIGTSLCRSWAPGWWQRHPDLTTFVVSSRREEAGGATAVPLGLHEDLFVMLAAAGRRWELKLWCALETQSAKMLLLPASPLTSLYELTVNVQGNTEVCASMDTAGGLEGSENRKAKGKRTAATTEGGDTLLFPALQSLTLANVEGRPLAAVEVLARLSVLAPNLKAFNVCDTARVPPVEKPKGRRKVPQ